MFHIFAQAATDTELRFRFARIQENHDWILPVLVMVLLLYWARRRYKIDGGELARWKRWTLIILRCAAIIGLFVFYLQPQWERIEGNSRAVILVDTSSSMGTRDVLENEDGSPLSASLNPESQGPSRLDAVIDWLKRSDLIEQLREKHDVVVYGFDRSVTRLALDEKDRPQTENEQTPSETVTENEETEPIETENPEATVSGNWLESLQPRGGETRVGDAIIEVLGRERGQPVAGVVLVTDGGNNSGRSPELAIEQAKRIQVPIYTIGLGATRLPLNFRIANLDVPERAFPNDPLTIKARIELQGGQDANDALRRTPVPDSAQQRWTVPVELWMRTASTPTATATEGESGETETPANVPSDSVKIGETQVEMTAGATQEVSFEILPVEIGKKVLSLKILPPKEDRIEEDNLVEAGMEIIDRKDRVLLFAGGPMRDYQFLRTQLNRDKTVSVDVFIPWTRGAVSQDAENILAEFPSTREDMAKYDCVVAFDPDWRNLVLPDQLDILEYWVARQGGGLILVASNVNLIETGGWLDDPVMERMLTKIRALYPVEFSAKDSIWDHKYVSDSQPWKVAFTRAGEEAEFLRPADSEPESRAIWDEFPGFYSYMNVKSIKPTATLYATSTSIDAAGSSGVPALFVEQFYGAGRVLYIGNGELWRLRQIEETYYEKLYTKMIRHVSQGRLQRQSDRGSLATDKTRYSLGTTASIRVTLNDKQLNPLEMPTYNIDVFPPNGKRRTLSLALDPNTPGLYLGHLSLQQEGNWRLQLAIPDEEELLTQVIQVRMSDLERENPARNVLLLTELADKTRGLYYENPELAAHPIKESEMFGSLQLFQHGVSSDNPIGEEKVPQLTELLKIRSQKAVLDNETAQDAMWIFLWAICGLVLLEWLLRRLMRLA